MVSLRKLAVACQVAYLDMEVGDDYETIDAELSFTVAHSFGSGYILDAGDEYVVAFRGTRDAEDVLADLGLTGHVTWHPRTWWNALRDIARLKEKTPQGHVHAGFLRRCIEVEWEIDELIRQLPHKPVVVTGHSLGGALAVLYASRASLRERLRHRHMEVVTFGQPRPGTASFARQFRLPYTRVVNNNDAVPRSGGLLFGWRHPKGELAWIDRNGNLQHNPPLKDRVVDRFLGRWDAVGRRIVGTLKALFSHTDGASDHFMASYRGHLERSRA